jgi:hypothetical protein
MELNSLYSGASITTGGGSVLTYSSPTPGWTTTTADINLNGNLTLNNNTSSMNQQVKVAVFKVTRNEDNKITSSTFISELWIEKKAGKSIDFAVAKELGDKYEADEIVIKEVFTVTL